MRRRTVTGNILIWMILAIITGQNSAAGQVHSDSIRVSQLIVLDTLSLKIPGPSNELAFYMNGLVFLSNSKFHQKMIPDHITFGRLQTYFVPLEYISLESSRPLFENDPFSYSPGGMSFSRDYRYVYFTKPVTFGRRTVEKIYEASIINSEVSQDRQLPFCSDPARYMHPAISVDGSFMVFASDRIPSSGGLDLFMVRKEETGWGTPVNLGRSINTSGHEWYPFLDRHHNLYFSSSGHMGFGGFDIYVCLFDVTGWGEPRNLTGFVNTGADDIAFSIHPNQRQVVYSTTYEGDESRRQAFHLKLNAGALLVAGVDEPRSLDISLLFKDLVHSGYSPADYVALEGQKIPEPIPEGITGRTQADEKPGGEESSLAHEPELQAAGEAVEEEKTGQEPGSELQAAGEPEQQEAGPELQAAGEQEPQERLEQETPEIEPGGAPVSLEPDRVIFRVQILSNSRPNSTPSVTINGKQYGTFEYYYKGAYRITVGSFHTVQEALEMRAGCREAGYDQAFVAAFRGNERELDPAVFRN